MRQFNCPRCNSKLFTLTRFSYTKVDFSREGAIEGHPFIHGAGEQFESLTCSACGTVVPDEQAQEMLREVV